MLRINLSCGYESQGEVIVNENETVKDAFAKAGKENLLTKAVVYLVQNGNSTTVRTDATLESVGATDGCELMAVQNLKSAR